MRTAMLVALLSGTFGTCILHASEVKVRDVESLRRALGSAKAGTRILLEPGEYAGGLSARGLAGAPGKPIVIGAADRARPPVIRGGGSGIQLTDPAHVEIEHLVVAGASGNGINIDDGGDFETPAHHVVIRDVTVREVGSRGNQDGIKLSGLKEFAVERCTIEGWGKGGGSGIDMVGCHEGKIAGNTFRNPGGEQSSGVQAKGGSTDIRIAGNRFEEAGGRAVNIGGSTGLEYFRPPLASIKGERFEAAGIIVEGNTFIGGVAPVAFVGSDRCQVRFNTIYKPGRWALRILQETREEGFVPSRRGEFTDNLVVYEARKWGGAANVGGGTEPASFRFARNFWYAEDAPERSRPDLPSAEADGKAGQDPLLEDPPVKLTVRKGSPALKVGAHALPRSKE